MNLTETIKNQDFFQKLIEKKDNNSLSNAMLFFCEDKITSAKTLILAALMLQYNTFELFNEKSAEFVRVESGVDLDIKIYPKNGEKLLVSDSNEIVAEVYTKPVNMQNKIFVINNFDISTQEAQNKLLKVLEEPPKNVYFLISAQSEEKVLPTIRSRCDKIKINPMSQAEMATISTDKIACVLGGGYVGKTLQLEKNDSLRRLTEFVVSLFTRLKSSKQVIKFSKTMIEEKDNLDLILEIACLCIEDMLKLKCESENLCKLTTFTQELQDAEPEFSVEALCEISKLVSNLREKLEFNANLTVAIDNFLLKMLEVKYLCK
ncbi:MAG: hypothetical protein IJX00_01195 [Clostridia bacterium]|nr:hypothetical protein [Clostridia bacterium]